MLELPQVRTASLTARAAARWPPNGRPHAVATATLVVWRASLRLFVGFSRLLGRSEDSPPPLRRG